MKVLGLIKILAPAYFVILLIAATPAFSGDGTTLGVSGPVTFIDGNAFFGGYLDLLTFVTPQIQAGVESGFQYYSNSDNYGDSLNGPSSRSVRSARS
jgi:hypothetical protein